MAVVSNILLRLERTACPMTRLGLFSLALLFGVLLGYSPNALWAAPAAPQESVRLGAYVTSLYDIDAKKGTFSADLWVWSLSKPDSKFRLDKTLEMNQLDGQLPINHSGFGSQELASGDVWCAKKVSATFLHQFNLQNYPFDRQRLRISFEDTDSNLGALQFAPDAMSGYDKDIVVEGWRLMGSRVAQTVKLYRSNFGNPSAPESERFSRIVLELEIQRDAPLLLLKATMGLFAAVFIAILSSLMSVKIDEIYAARITLNGGMLLATVISHQFSDSADGQTTAVTLIDSIHMLGIATVATLFMMTFISRKLMVNKPHAAVTKKVDMYSFILSAILFSGLCLLLV